MAIHPFHWDDLGRFKRDPRFIAHYPPDVRSFFSPDDDIHGLLMSLLASSQQSIVLNMYGYADHELDDVIRSKLLDERVYVQMSLDRSQSKSSKTEREILAEWENGGIGNSIAIGTSYKHAISHLKIVIVDGIYTVKGSTNWSISGEQQQDNELTLSRNAVIAAETRAVLDLNHDWMLKQMAASRKKASDKKVPELVRTRRTPKPKAA
jgi:phosphatidylserine/phosphatidylglycerophosphate/cardiolipin synthase-like enzyme